MKTTFRSTAFAIILLALTGISDAHAACTSPAGIEGSITWNGTNAVIWCDGTNWNSLASGGGGGLTGGTSGYLGVWSGATSLGLSSTSAGNQLFWDGANNRLGIGTTAPSARLDVWGTSDSSLAAQFGGAGVPRIRLYGDQGAGTGAMIDFNTGNGGSLATANGSGASIRILPGSGGPSPGTTFAYNGNVGIGTTTPVARLHVADPSAPMIFDESDQTGVPGYWRFVTDGGTYRIDQNTSASRNLSTYRSPFSIDSSGNIRLGGYAAGGGGNETLFVGANGGNVGIGTVSPSYKLHVIGQVAGNAAYVNTSDGRLKKDVAEIGYGLDTVMKLHPVSFQWKAQKEDWQKGRKLGLIAQEAEKIVPEVVSTANDPIRTKSIAYGDLTPVLIKAVQELKADNDDLRTALKAANDNDAAQASALEEIRREIDTLKATR